MTTGRGNTRNTTTGQGDTRNTTGQGNTRKHNNRSS